MTEANATSKPKREKKEAFKIDFLAPAENDLKDTAKELFAPVTRGAGISLPIYTSGKGKKGKKSKAKEKQSEHTLPDDMHFSSRQLVTLFLKPKFSVRPLLVLLFGLVIYNILTAEDAWAACLAERERRRRSRRELLGTRSCRSSRWACWIGWRRR